ncbi:reverse transcriptase domain-containing protein [Tanacetum coccineum]
MPKRVRWRFSDLRGLLPGLRKKYRLNLKNDMPPRDKEWGGREIKEKNKDVVAKDCVSPSVSDESVVKEKQISLVDTSIPIVENTDLRSYPPLPTQGSTPTGFKFSYFIYTGGNGVDVVVTMESIRAISGSSMDGLNAMLENGPWFIRNHLLILKKWNPNVNLLKEYVGNVPTWGMSSYAGAIIELRADMELKDTIVVAMPKLTGEGFYICTVCVEYEWKPLRCACCKIFGHTHEECPKNPGLGVAKNLKKPIQAPRGVSVGQKVGFKPSKEYKSVSKKPAVNTSGTKKKGTSNVASNEANSSGSSFWNVETSSTSNTPIVDKIRKLEKLIIKGKVTLVDDDGKPLKKVDYAGDHDSVDEVESVDNDMARSMASERVGFGTKSLLE